MRYIVPQWDESIRKKDFGAARVSLDNAAQISTHVPAGKPMLAMLGWMTDLQQFIAERGGENAPIVIYEHEAKIQKLLEWWDSDKEGRRRMVGQIARYEPAFESARNNTYSLIRLLRSEKATYLGALERFKKTLTQKIDADNLDGLGQYLSDFKARYPRVGGLGKLEQDVEQYLLVNEDIRAGQWLRAVRKIEKMNFSTPVFLDRMAQIRNQRLPPDTVVQRYDGASRLWQSGQPEKAIAELESLGQGEWGRVVADELARKRGIVERYNALKTDKNRAGYAKDLIALFGSLDPLEDKYFISQIGGEFEVHREKVLADAKQALDEARTAWVKYRDNGGIMGLQRLEASLSRQFRNQAARLSTAYNRVRHGAEIYKLLNFDNASGWQDLYQSILKESRLQRRSLQELRMVLKPSLLDAKLRLLPDPDQALSTFTQERVSYLFTGGIQDAIP